MRNISSSKDYWGWSNGATAWAWGAVNPLGVLVSRDKPNLTLKDREKDKKILIKFLKGIKFIHVEDVNIDEILDYIYRK